MSTETTIFVGVGIQAVPEWPGDLLGLLVALITLLVIVPLTQKIDPPKPLRNGNGEEVPFEDRPRALSIFPRTRT